MSNSKNSLARCWLTIERNSPRLFVSDSNSCRVEIWDVAPESDSQVERTDFCNGTTQVNKRFVSTVAEMDNALKMARSPASARMAIIHRANSWSRMKITVEMFKLLCVASQMDASFMALVLGMGKKSQPQDEHFMGSYARFYNIPQPRPCLENEDGQAMNGLVFVLGYKIRYLERHGRDLKDPWSCRQSVVHQSYSFEHNVTNLVVIHPSQKFNELIEDLKMEFDVHPLNFHLRYIVAATQTWREYLDAIHLDLLSLDQKVSFPKRFQEFDLDFSVSQHLQWTRRKLYQAETILRGTQAILRTVRDHEKKLCGLGLISSSVRLGFLCEMENINREIGSHCNTVHELIKLSDDMKSMISDILNFRNQELLVTNGLHLSKIADMNHTDSETLINMAATSSRDSKTTRIATMIAMLYLPASLVLSFFSTGFVEFHSGGQSGLSVNRDIWIPVVSIVVLGLTTLLGFWAWLRRGTISHGHFKNP